MKLQINRIDQHALTGFINRVKLIDSFVYMKINNGQIESTVYLPQRDAVKHHSVEANSIFQVDEWPETDKEMKIAFFEGSKVIEALKHFDSDAIKGELEFIENEGELVASTLRIFNDELEITLSCSEPSLGFKDLTPEQRDVIFARTDAQFDFSFDTHMINKVKNLFSLDKEETFGIKSDVSGVNVDGKSFNVLLTPDTSGNGNVTVYKKYLNLLDKEEQTVFVSGSKVVFESNDSTTLLTVSTCQTA
mgnify:FL=1|jgi:hypothetical protein|tara:strand:- start:294 stop:1037 length:744 start_codon:yes stop_codon:yes gene_type:complete